MIRLENVNKYFNRRKSNEIHVINNTSLELEDKGLVAFLGNSGCGKTTLLNAIGGLDKVNSGNIYIDEKNISRGSSNKIDNIRNAAIGYIFQNYNLIEDATVYDNVALVLRMVGVRNKAEIDRRVMYILKRVGIERYKNRPARMLSGGERQRVGIARALVKNPKIIIADEPTGNLDSKNTIEIMNIIKAISKERLVILVTHEKEIAEFYASRIVQIVDGCVVSDRENIHDDSLDYRMDNKIYLLDLPSQETLDGDGVKVRYYSDNSVDAGKLEIKVVVKNGNIYIERPEGLREGFDGIELVDDHYKAISKEVYENYQFEYEEIKGKNGRIRYTSVFNPVTMITGGFRKVFSYSVIKKILLVGFVCAAMVSTYAAGNIAGITNITDDKFVTVNKNYLTVNTGKLTPSKFEKYEKMKGVDYVLPGDSRITMNFRMDDYYQTADAVMTINGSLSARSLIDSTKIVAGAMPKKSKDIIIDKIVADRLFDEGSVKMIGLRTYDSLIGRKVDVPHLGDYTIAGVTDQGSPCIYVKKSLMMDTMMASAENPYTSEYDGEMYFDDDGAASTEDAFDSTKIAPWSWYEDDKAISITKGEAPKKLYEVLIPADQESWEVGIGSELKKKVNGHNLVVCGFYENKRGDSNYYVSKKTARYDFLKKFNSLIISADDKTATFEKISAKNVKISDNYADAREEYIKSIKKTIVATILVGIVILVISLAEMYLMLRSSFLSRIKEVGVLRAIGLKKKDIYKMFFGEIIALTIITGIPGVAVAASFVAELAKAPYIGDQYFMNVPLAVLMFAILLGFNMLAGLLPVMMTMRKTPAQILARNDVN